MGDNLAHNIMIKTEGQTQVGNISFIMFNISQLLKKNEGILLKRVLVTRHQVTYNLLMVCFHEKRKVYQKIPRIFYHDQIIFDDKKINTQRRLVRLVLNRQKMRENSEFVFS